MTVSKTQIETNWSLILLWTFTVLIAVGSLRFLIIEVPTSMPHMLHHAVARPLSLYVHIGLSPLVLLLLPIQFNRKLRIRQPALHRWAGRLYGVLILLGGISGLVLASTTEAGNVAAFGFGFLAVFWLGVTARAIQLAMQKKIAAHRRWMIRSAALSLAAVTLRIFMPIGVLTIGAEAAYELVAWACWVPNLILAEWLLRRGALR